MAHPSALDGATSDIPYSLRGRMLQCIGNCFFSPFKFNWWTISWLVRLTLFSRPQPGSGPQPFNQTLPKRVLCVGRVLRVPFLRFNTTYILGLLSYTAGCLTDPGSVPVSLPGRVGCDWAAFLASNQGQMEMKVHTIAADKDEWIIGSSSCVFYSCGFGHPGVFLRVACFKAPCPSFNCHYHLIVYVFFRSGKGSLVLAARGRRGFTRRLLIKSRH